MERDVREIKYFEMLIKNEKDPLVKDRLRGILLLKKNYNRIEVAKILGVTDRTLYNWKYRYAEKRYEGLLSKPIPGRSTFLDDEDMAKLKELLKKRQYWTAKGAQMLINEEFGRMFVLRQVHRILRKLGMHCAKPNVNDYRRPPDAEEILKKDFRKRHWRTMQ
ncbi:MAG: helix-turn-helix domain-containing protein [Euryarchaeota archaeon]|nr:helix-turn-helix domain-containing protein [Euryarchaeota archaeon]